MHLDVEGGIPGLIGETEASGIYGFDDSLAKLTRGTDGVYRFDHVDTIPLGQAPFTVEYQVTVTFDR